MTIKCPECGSRNVFLHGYCGAGERCYHKAHLGTCNDCKVLTEFRRGKHDRYNAPEILDALKRSQLPQGVVGKETGLSHIVLRKLVRGEAVDDSDLLTMLRYIESLKAEKAA